MSAERPLRHMRSVQREFPTAWDDAALWRDAFPDRAEQHYLPTSAAEAIVLRSAGVTAAELSRRPVDVRVSVAHASARVSAIAAWRMSKGVYQFDPHLLEALWNTPISGNLPGQLLHRLPEWCVYIPLPAMESSLGLLHGFYAWVEHAPGDSGLHVVLDGEVDGVDALLPFAISLSEPTILAGLQRATEVWLRDTRQTAGVLEMDRMLRDFTRTAGPIISLLLYLCSEAPDISGKGQPGNPEPVRTKRGIRTFPAGSERLWNVGVRVGAAIRNTEHAASQGGGESGRSVRPHWRRAHWNLYWTGPRTGPRVPVLKWIPMTAVAFRPDDTEELPAVIRPVEAE